MDENIRSIVAGDEPESLRIVEPFHLAGCHLLPSYERSNVDIVQFSPALPGKLGSESTGAKKSVKSDTAGSRKARQGLTEPRHGRRRVGCRHDRPDASDAARAGRGDLRDVGDVEPTDGQQRQIEACGLG